MTVPARVSVVIPTFNRRDLLGEAVESALQQTYPEVEVVVVDDGSTDGTPAFLESMKDRIRGLRLPRSGVSAARNAGIAASTGDFVAFLDSDDLWDPDKIERQMELFRRHPETGMVGGGCRYIGPGGQRLSGEENGPPVVGLAELQISTALPGSASNVLVRRSVLEDVGGFDPTLFRAEDRELWIRIAQRYPIRCVTRPTVSIRLHDGPRPNGGLALSIAARREVNRRIPDRRDRRKAEAWMWFNLGLRSLSGDRRARALCWIVRSFAVHPGRLHPRLSRLRPLLRRVLPGPLQAFVQRLRAGRVL